MNDPKSTNGEDIKKENVTPTGSPAFVNPINIGIEEQLQKGVTVPSKALKIFAFIPLKFPRIFFVLSGGKKLWIYEITKIRMDKSTIIFIVSYIKNWILPPILLWASIPKTVSPFFTKLSNHNIFKNWSSKKDQIAIIIDMDYPLPFLLLTHNLVFHLILSLNFYILLHQKNNNSIFHLFCI